MTLYFMPGASSLAPHIALQEAGLPFSLVAVDYRTRQAAGGDDFRRINPKGYVPALVLGSGEVLTEVPVILKFVDSKVPQAALLPASGLHRWRSLEWLNFIATEIHKSFSPLFRPETLTSFCATGRLHLCRRLSVVEDHLSQQEYLTGADFSLADVYLFVLCRWLKDQDMALADWPSLYRHSEIIGMRSSVQQAMGREGLL